MISEEEKEAIDYLQFCYDISTIGKESLPKLGIALNLIDKLQKENEEYHRIKKELIRVNKKIYDVDTIDEFIETIDKLQKELDKKDKLIELIYNLFYEYISIRPMSGIKFLNDKGFSKCKNCEKELEDENGISCKDCIKEQFVKKVEEGNE